MANFDPKTTIERLLSEYPSCRELFPDESGCGQMTVEEYSFANGIEIIPFFEEIDRKIAAAQKETAKRAECGQHTADTPAAPATPSRRAPVLTGLLAFTAAVLTVNAVANLWDGLPWLRGILGIRPMLNLPHIPQMLGLLSLAGMAGCLLLLLWRKIGIVILFAGAMLYDILAVALTDGIPYQTFLAAAVCLCLIYKKSESDGKPCREHLR